MFGFQALNRVGWMEGAVADGERTGPAPAQPLDRLIYELQARSATKAAGGAFTSPQTPPPSDTNSPREEIGPPPPVPLGGSEAKTARSRRSRLAFLFIPHRFELGQIRRPLIPAAIISAMVGVGGVSMMVSAPENLSTPISRLVDASDAPIEPAQVEVPKEQASTALDNTAELQRQEQPVQEPITRKFVKTVRIYEPVDQLAPNLGPWDESAVAKASLDERLQAGDSEPARSEEAVIETESRAADPDRWLVAIASKDAPSEEPTADRTDELDFPEAPAEHSPAPLSATASAPGPTAAAGDDFSASAAASRRSVAEPTRRASVTTHVNMRSRPASNAAVVRVIPAGAGIGVVRCDNWCEVVFEKERGWIYRRFVTGASRDGEMRQMAAGTPLISADGAQLGVVRGRSTDADGQAFIVVDLSRELKAAVRSVRLRSEHIASADDQAQIKVTRAQFISSLP
jgi:hypothetical protein